MLDKLVNQEDCSYIKYADLAAYLPIKEGDIVLVTSNVLKVVIDAQRHGEQFDSNIFIDSLLQKIGGNGTLLFPTFNWGFCRGATFDIINTPSEVGGLSNAALKRNDFSRTQHPIYSFAVTGRYKSEICKLENISAWSEDSPFGFLRRSNANNLFVDIDYKNNFTFGHYCEETCNVGERYSKPFISKYIDIDGTTSVRTYRMFARDLDINNGTKVSEKLDEAMLQAGCYHKLTLNRIPYSLINLNPAAEIIISDLTSKRRLWSFKRKVSGI